MKKKKVIKKKKVMPKLAPQLKETMSTLKQQADEITVTSFMPPLPKVKSEPLFTMGYEFRKDYTVMLDCLAAISFAGACTVVGMLIEHVR